MITRHRARANGTPPPRGAAPPQARTITDTEYQRRRRHGQLSGGRGVDTLVWTETRNGVPWKPYVYRGAG